MEPHRSPRWKRVQWLLIRVVLPIALQIINHMHNF
jgi:hypothetical protein